MIILFKKLNQFILQYSYAYSLQFYTILYNKIIIFLPLTLLFLSIAQI